MLCTNVCECRTVHHDLCVIMAGSGTVYAGFVDGNSDPFAVCGHCKVMHTMKHAEVHSDLIVKGKVFYGLHGRVRSEG